jgi:protein SCO1/2
MTYKNNQGFTRNSILLLLILGVAGITAGVLAGYLVRQQQSVPRQDTQALLAYPQPRVIADFALFDQHGEKYSLQDLKNRWSLVFLGFTHCPNICPTTLSMLAQVSEQLSGQLPESMQPRVIFISVDPERDLPEQLQRYVSYFDPGFIAATGAHPQLKALSHQLGAVYRIQQHDEGDNDYDVDHTTGIFLLNPQAKLVGQFQAPHRSRLIVMELKQLILADRTD